MPTRLMPFSTFLLIWMCLHPVVALAQQQAAPQGSQPATAPTPATQEAEENYQKEAEETKRLTELYSEIRTSSSEKMR